MTFAAYLCQLVTAIELSVGPPALMHMHVRIFYEPSRNKKNCVWPVCVVLFLFGAWGRRLRVRLPGSFGISGGPAWSVPSFWFCFAFAVPAPWGALLAGSLGVPAVLGFLWPL